MNNWFLLFLPLLIIPSVYAQSLSDESTFSQYVLKIDDHDYDLSYAVNGNVIAMDIDPESKSLLVGLENTLDSRFSIRFSQELISAPNNEFVILVDGQDTGYEITSDSDNLIMSFFVPVGTQEVEIIGTSVIPEFPIGAIFGLVFMVSFVVVFSKFRTSFFRL